MKYILTLIILFTGWALQAQSQQNIYDDFNRLVEVIYSNGLKIKYTYDKLGNRLNYEVTRPSVAVSVKAILSGPYDEETGLMTDHLLKLNLIPNQEPYTSLGYTFHGSNGGEVIDNPSAVFAVDGPDAIVDWVLLELRDKKDPILIQRTRAALLQRDGDIVDVDGVSEVIFQGTPWDDYYLAVRHRNHLGMMTANAIPLTTGVSL